ncbi:hypothetical protein [Amycolatopsis marina]|uniref:hypothetical protein n=1 Tax=Amycolatopsis marina TaxID=490629 RepID=UPI000B86AD36|nr:hypothetical protein [Amycolatopsis marina]
MIARAVVLPHPPLLVPELVPGSVESTEAVRSACLAAAAELAAAADQWFAVGPGAGARTLGARARGSFAGYGVDVPVALSRDAAGAAEELPLPALIAGWLRERAGANSVRVRLVPPEAGELADAAAELAELDRADDRLGLLVLGDGSNRHGARSPGSQDDRAPAFDDAVAAALGTADTAALRAIDPVLSAELGTGGWAPWQVLAGYAEPGRWSARMLYSGAPFGVRYHVAVWERG